MESGGKRVLGTNESCGCICFRLPGPWGLDWHFRQGDWAWATVAEVECLAALSGTR
jgi:hypothetical protein